MSSSWRDSSLAACEKARSFFSEELAEWIKSFDPEAPAAKHLGEYLTRNVFFFLRERRDHMFYNNREHPTSVDDFLRTISPAFDHRYLKSFKANCDHFDRIVGGPNSHSSTTSSSQLNLSDIFMGDLGFDSWVVKICLAIALYCFETVAPGEKFAQRPMPQYDGPLDTLLPSIQAGVIDDSGLLKQVTLVGPNLYEAWNRLEFTRNLENTCPQSSTWTPSQPGGLYVYHGTAAHFDHADFILALANHPFNFLMGKSHRNQITQGKDSIPVVWTAFSPFRAFLWAVFVADITENIPGPRAQSRLTSVWQCGSKTYEGVLVFQFSSTQPSPPGCSSYTIPPGQEEQWSAIAATGSELAYNEPTKNLWAKFASLHNQATGSEWPDLVHGLELRSSREILRRFTRQFWRTVWFGQGIQSLNSCHVQSLAIRYIIGPDSLQLPPKDEEVSTKDKGAPLWQKMGTLKKRVSRIFKKNLD